LTKADIVDKIAGATGLTKVETEAVINGFIASIKEAIIDGEIVHLRGFGSFRAQHRASRTARNPRTNQEVKLGERFVPVFKPAKEFKENVNKALK